MFDDQGRSLAREQAPHRGRTGVVGTDEHAHASRCDHLCPVAAAQHLPCKPRLGLDDEHPRPGHALFDHLRHVSQARADQDDEGGTLGTAGGAERAGSLSQWIAKAVKREPAPLPVDKVDGWR